MKTINTFINEKLKINKNTKLEDNDYIDLGLPSGNLWAAYNYNLKSNDKYGKLYTFNEAKKLDIILPSLKDFKELFDNCTHEWTIVDKLKGQLFTSKINDKSIFFPAEGCQGDLSTYYKGSSGYYWTDSESSKNTPYYISFNKFKIFPQNINAYDENKFSIRQIKK